MKRRIVVTLAVVLAALLALVALDGLGYHSDVEYVEIVSPPISNENRIPEVFVSSTRNAKAGFYEFVSFSNDGPPFELHMSGTAPAGSAAITCQIVSLVVHADDAAVLSVSNRWLPLNVQIGARRQSAAKGFFFTAPSFLSGTPRRLQVRGTISFPSPAGDATVSFERAFELRASKR